MAKQYGFERFSGFWRSDKRVFAGFILQRTTHLAFPIKERCNKVNYVSGFTHSYSKVSQLRDGKRIGLPDQWESQSGPQHLSK